MRKLVAIISALVLSMSLIVYITEKTVSVVLTDTQVKEVSSKRYLTGDSVRLRSLATTKSSILGILNTNQEVELLYEDGGWGFVRIGDIKGFVSLDFLSANKIIKETCYTVAIDAGHQARGNNEHEPIGPGATSTKPKVSSGTQGTLTKVPEYKLTLSVSLKLKDELLTRGYNVVMIRETNDVNISNKERAEIAAAENADILVRIHADGLENSNVSGILTLCPTKNNPFVPHLYENSRALSDNILSSMIELTGAKKRGVLEVDNMSGINWATMPVTIVEMGLMTNHAEDKLMQEESYQQKLAEGIADGIDKFFTHSLMH